MSPKQENKTMSHLKEVIEECKRQERHDPVNHPLHYEGAIECIDAIEAALGESGFEAYLVGQIFKYVWRYQRKNGLEDLRKADWYMKRLIKLKECECAQ
jgi:hypothetical protein